MKASEKIADIRKKKKKKYQYKKKDTINNGTFAPCESN